MSFTTENISLMVTADRLRGRREDIEDQGRIHRLPEQESGSIQAGRA
jgi:hypothetical protein